MTQVPVRSWQVNPSLPNIPFIARKSQKFCSYASGNICHLLNNCQQTKQICMFKSECECVCVRTLPMFGLMSCQVPENVFPFIRKQTQFNFPLSWQEAATTATHTKSCSHLNYINIRRLSTEKLLILQTNWPKVHLQDPNFPWPFFFGLSWTNLHIAVLILLGNL